VGEGESIDVIVDEHIDLDCKIDISRQTITLFQEDITSTQCKGNEDQVHSVNDQKIHSASNLPTKSQVYN
jgi:hypothetical protein